MLQGSCAVANSAFNTSAPCYTRPILAALFNFSAGETPVASSSAVAILYRQVRLRHLLLAALLAMFLFVLWRDERWFLTRSGEEWTYFFPVRWLLVPHALSGLIALLIGPFQFSSRLRQRHLRIHRIMGRTYLVSVAVSAIVALYISAIHQSDVQGKAWIFTLAITWLITGAMAFAAVRKGNIEAHRQWIARNYAFTTVFVTVRVVHALPIPDAYGDTPSWILLLATLLLTEAGLSWRGVFTDRRSQRLRPD
jgi:uncharacterized membrane protein